MYVGDGTGWLPPQPRCQLIMILLAYSLASTLKRLKAALRLSRLAV